MPHSFVAYVDESGCEGNAVGRGASEFIVVAAIVIRVQNEPMLAEGLAEARITARKPEGWVWKTFKDLNSQSQRWLLCETFAARPIQCVAVSVHKPTLLKPEWHANHGDLYFYAAKMLAERISWVCRDGHRANPAEHPMCSIVFSDRQSLQYQNFQTHLRTLQGDPVRYSTNADWNHISPDLITSIPHDNNHAGLLAADYWASSLGAALEFKEHGILDDRFIRAWGPKIYAPNGRKAGNGLKFWPPPCLDIVRQDARSFWINHFKI